MKQVASQQFNEVNDGVLLALTSFGCSEFGWKLDYVLDEASMLSLLLLLRQKATNEGKQLFSLADKEAMDSKSWDELLEENREKMKKFRMV